jgi:hypothetical protein
MGELANIAKGRNPYLTLEDGESTEAVYKGFKMVPSTFDPEKENFRFMLEIKIAGETQLKFWDTSSNKIAFIFDQCKEGDRVVIVKHVENKGLKNEKTRWEAQRIIKDEV